MRIAVVFNANVASDGALVVARELRGRGHAVTLVVPQVAAKLVTPDAARQWLAEGFAWLPVGAARLVPAQENFPRYPSVATARALSDVLEPFDAVWFCERHWAAPLLRARRFRERALPVVVLGAEPVAGIPATMEAVNLAGAAAYAERWADRVLVGGERLGEEIAAVEGMWRMRAEVVMPTAAEYGGPSLRFRMTAKNEQRQEQEQTQIPFGNDKQKGNDKRKGEDKQRGNDEQNAVTVCVPYYEAVEFLPLTLASLERQTSDAFTVIVVDDGSPGAEAQRVFAECEQRYSSSRGWRFLRQENTSPGAARNHAAREATTEFLLFLDSDDIAMPTMVERFLRAARLTGDDCLVVPNYGFESDPEGPSTVLYDPPGNHLIASMGDDMHGGSCIFVRREAFEAIGGFTAVRGVGFEDYELHVRFNLRGMRWDVLPEMLYRYRMPRAKSVSRSTSQYPNHAGVLRRYAEQLQPLGLEQLPLAFASVYREQERVAEQLKELQQARRRPSGAARGRDVKLLLVTCNFPYGVTSGWHTRVREMIRYFGSRHELTLLTSMPREEFAPLRAEAMQYLQAVRGVEGSKASVAVGDDLPFRVRQHTTDRMQEALRSLPTCEYHAVLLDQIFLGELRKEIDAPCVLTEHNIESRLLRQAAGRMWDAALPEAYRNPLIEAERMERYEDKVWPEFALRAAVSEADRAEIERRAPGAKTVVAPNGADPAAWLPQVRFSVQTVLFVGHLAYLPNGDAVEFLLREIWPRVIARVPAARLIVAGREPSQAMCDAVARAKGAELCASPRSMAAVAARASMTVAPLRLGSGTRVKILESLAWGLPVVSTTIGAEGIDVVDGEQALLADDAEEFAEAMVRLLCDEALWGKLRAEGHELIRTRYSWDRVFEPLEAGLLELIS